MADDTIGISGGERLDRIEKLLERIDGKLEAKVDKSDFTALELRVRDIELHGSTGLQATSHEIEAVKHQAAKDAAAIRDQVTNVQRKMAYATGTVSAFVIFVNLALYYLTR